MSTIETTSDIGGCVIVRPTPIKYGPGTVQGYSLLSDLHLGASNVDYKLIDTDLKTGKDRGDRIALNGDIFDAIFTRDKRFQPDVLHPKLRGCRDIVNGVMDMAEEILAPYASHIDMIALGNHCSAVEKYNNIDLIKLLIDKLERHTKHKIAHGGYTGFLDYRFRNSKEDNGHGKRFVIYYHHGSGSGSSAATKGTGDLHNKMWVEADVIWLGHKHTKVSTAVQTMRCPQSGYEPVMREVRQIITGAYYDVYKGQTQESIRKTGRKANYAADAGYAPQGKGGARIELTFPSVDRPYIIKVSH